MRAFNYWFSFSGRIGRAQWWIGQIGLILIMAAAAMLLVGVMVALGVQDFQHSNAAQAMIGVLMLVYFASWLAIHVRRWHDLGKSGWWQLLMLVPFGSLYILIMCGFVPGDYSDNAYGPDPLNQRTFG
jgi:uncharacterized membrane protein YhaH (DUF805 family)